MKCRRVRALVGANAAGSGRFEFLLDSENYCMQEKKDGVRKFVTRAGDQITGGNRKGLIVAVSRSTAAGVLSLRTKRDADFILDGEAIGDVYWPFDVLRYGGQDTTGMPVENRWSLLEGLLGTTSLPAIEFPVTPLRSSTTNDRLLCTKNLHPLHRNLAPEILFVSACRLAGGLV